MEYLKNIFFYFKEYLKYCLKATDEYSIHSPLIFDLYNNIKTKNIEQEIKDYFSKDVVVELYDYDSIIQKLKEYKVIIIIIKDIHKTANKSSIWEKIKRMENVAFVSVDFFRLGVIIKTESVLKRQHYILKRK